MIDLKARVLPLVESFAADLVVLFRRSMASSVDRLFDERSSRRRAASTNPEQAPTPRRPARTAAPQPNRPSARSTRTQRSKGAKRSPEELEQLLTSLRSYVAKNPGARMEQISAALGTSTKELMLPVRKLVKARKLKTKGQKRATTYYPA